MCNAPERRADPVERWEYGDRFWHAWGYPPSNKGGVYGGGYPPILRKMAINRPPDLFHWIRRILFMVTNQNLSSVARIWTLFMTKRCSMLTKLDLNQSLFLHTLFRQPGGLAPRTPRVFFLPKSHFFSKMQKHYWKQSKTIFEAAF